MADQKDMENKVNAREQKRRDKMLKKKPHL